MTNEDTKKTESVFERIRREEREKYEKEADRRREIKDWGNNNDQRTVADRFNRT